MGSKFITPRAGSYRVQPGHSSRRTAVTLTSPGLGSRGFGSSLEGWKFATYGGRFHVRRLLDVIARLKKPWHHARVTQAMIQDCQWWQSYMRYFNGSVNMVDPRPVTPVYIDSCNVGAGGTFNGDWFHAPWDAFLPEAKDLHINDKEVLALEPACLRWAPLWANRKVLIHSDNQVAVAQINRGSSRSPVVMAALRRIFWWSARFNFLLSCVYLPGVSNTLADAASRLHEPGGGARLADAMICL